MSDHFVIWLLLIPHEFKREDPPGGVSVSLFFAH